MFSVKSSTICTRRNFEKERKKDIVSQKIFNSPSKYSLTGEILTSCNNIGSGGK